jgi:hypothetical protein
MSALKSADWVDQMLALGVIGTVDMLGVESQERNGKLRFICTGCNQETRHASRRDRRLSAEITSNGNGWKCYACGETGGAFDVLALNMFGAKYATLSMYDKMRFKQEAVRLCGSVPEEVKNAPRRGPEPVEPTYPPEVEVQQLWAAALPVDKVPHAVAWTERHRCDLERSVASDMVRVLPEFCALPRWATHWRASGNKLLFKMFDNYGVLRSLEGRRSWSSKEGPKAQGADLPNSRLRLVFACPVGRTALELGQRAGRVVWHEGPKKTLQGHLDDPNASHIGVVTGSITPQLLSRFSPDCSHEILTDMDKPGAQFATLIIRAMSAAQRRSKIRIPAGMKVEIGKLGVQVVLR